MKQLKRAFDPFRGLALPAAIALGIALGAPTLAREDAAPPTKEPAANPAPDRVVLRSGKVVDGLILEETDAQITMNVVIGGMSAKTVYPKTDILEIKRGNNTKVPSDAVAVKTKETPSLKKKEDKKKDEAKDEAAVDDSDPSLTRLYVVNLEGRFGFDVAKTTLVNLFEEADKELNDTVPGSGVMEGKTVIDPSKRERNIIVLKIKCEANPRGDIFGVEDIVPVVKEQIIDRGRRVIMWVEQATGWAAVFPFISPDIYFTPEGRLGGINDLDEFDIGDHLVNEKQISLRIGHAEGFLIKGGYGDHIPALRAMVRKQEWLYVKFEGGKPIYLTRELEAKDGEGWVLLSDDGDGDNEDESALIGNDMFLLEPDWAEKLGISDGTVENIDDLAFRLGVQRHYTTIEKNKAQKAVEAWKDGIEDAFKNVNPRETEQARLGKLWRDLAEIPDGSDFNDRKKNRGLKVTLLRKIRSIVSTYAEVLDPTGDFRSNIDVQIAQLQQAAEADARQNRNNNTNNNRR